MAAQGPLLGGSSAVAYAASSSGSPPVTLRTTSYVAVLPSVPVRISRAHTNADTTFSGATDAGRCTGVASPGQGRSATVPREPLEPLPVERGSDVTSGRSEAFGFELVAPSGPSVGPGDAGSVPADASGGVAEP